MRERHCSTLVTVTLSALASSSLILAVAGCVSKPPAAPEPAIVTKPVSDPAASDSGSGVSAAARPRAPGAVAKQDVTSAADSAFLAGASGAATAGAAAPVAQTSASGSYTARPVPVQTTGSSVPLGYAQTAEERRAVLDKRLNDSLGTFDAKLRAEQQKIAQERDARQSTMATLSNSARGNDDIGAGGASGSARGTDRSSRTTGNLKSDKSGGNASTTGNGAVATEIPDGNDDDVVARRLRKAAEQETDPELKDKLWKEYVEYKKNTGK